MHIDYKIRDEFYKQVALDSARLRALIAEKSEKYPEIKLTCGYVGNIWWEPQFSDDTQWMVFTKVRDANGYSMSSPVRFPVDKISDLIAWVESDLDDWIEKRVTIVHEYNKANYCTWDDINYKEREYKDRELAIIRGNHNDY